MYKDKSCDVALIQEPRCYNGIIRGLKEAGEELIYNRTTKTPRTCIIIKNNTKILPLINLCSRDLTAVKIKSSSKEGPREIVLGSTYLVHQRCGEAVRKRAYIWSSVVMQTPITLRGGVQTPTTEVSLCTILLYLITSIQPVLVTNLPLLPLEGRKLSI